MGKWHFFFVAQLVVFFDCRRPARSLKDVDLLTEDRRRRHGGSFFKVHTESPGGTDFSMLDLRMSIFWILVTKRYLFNIQRSQKKSFCVGVGIFFAKRTPFPKTLRKQFEKLRVEDPPMKEGWRMSRCIYLLLKAWGIWFFNQSCFSVFRGVMIHSF